MAANLLVHAALTTFASTASASAPQFTGDPADVAVARAAWAAAEGCTGRPGRATREVEIRHRTIPGGYLGVAHTKPDGTLFRIDLNAEPERRREVLAHEVSHAWVSSGPVALVEGAAEVLGDCIVASTPGLATLQFDDGRDLSSLRDLRTWAAPGVHGTHELGAIRTDAYIGAARLMRTLAMVLPPGALWAEHGLSWEKLEGQLAEAGEPGQQLIEVLRGGAAAQRVALADADLDGVPALAEALQGTRDDAFDSDGDGWWDGADSTMPAGAVAVPLDGTPVCSGYATPYGHGKGATVHIYAGGNLRGHSPPRVVARAGTRGSDWSPPRQEGGRWGATVGLVPPHTSVLLQLDRDPEHATGAPWARVQSSRLEVDHACVSTSEATVWAHQRQLAPMVAMLTPHVHEAIARATERLGPAPARFALALGGPRSEVQGPTVWLSTAQVVAAFESGDLRALAFEAVAVHHLFTRGEPDWAGGEALSKALLARYEAPAGRGGGEPCVSASSGASCSAGAPGFRRRRTAPATTRR